MAARCLAVLFLGVTLCAWSGAAVACPNPAIGAFSRLDANGATLRLGDSRRVDAGGDTDLAGCAMGLDAPVDGRFNTVPSLTADLAGMTGLAIEIAVVSRCATALLVRTADNRWFHDSDGQGPGRPRLLLTQPSSGTLSVWVGTPDGQTCTARVTLQTMFG
ncbi:non-specific serine/threonine protein kinase [Loktanella fryxellensis]|uniref:Non-specific serine/threonine protein kinase n=1 Tax=Loktanella fryxellensis TaxID=245187 RepID=A0A1H7YFH3_9RHOB|nr:hypothetical protein [Loktanella fryxellensis]SEM44651.1 non-specific serine/threonine protein kinase [Loktanella fryxellensis]